MIVSIEIADKVAGLAACQHTAWMLVNLLARQERIVAQVALGCPPAVPLVGRVVPLGRRDTDLRGALIEGAAAIDCVPAVEAGTPPADAIRLVVGPGEALEGAIRVHGERWWGGISSGAIRTPNARCPLPYGPYAAACLAASNVYLAVRLANPAKPTATAFYSTWSLEAFAAAPTDARDVGPESIEGVEIDAILAGGGAVGNTWVHAMWASHGVTGRAIVADADELGVDTTNLNRCPTFGATSIGERKASEAARICADASVAIIPFDGPVGDVEERPSLLISAVDTNTSRRAVQGLYPHRLLAASTHNLRAEVLRCDPDGGAACVSCFNPPETDIPDADLRRQYLAAPEEDRACLAADVGLSVDEAERWAVEGTCSYATDRLLDRLRAADASAPAFAVGFVSVMAGTMLAAQTIRESLGDHCLDRSLCRGVFTFLDPTAATNAPRRLLRDSGCPMCDPEGLATRIWRRRHQEWQPPGQAWDERRDPGDHPKPPR